MNHGLIRDERHRNSMTLGQLQDRMRGWLEREEYRAVIFEADGNQVGYALFRVSDDGVYLRQFYIRQENRRRGFGRAAVDLLRSRVFPDGKRVTLEVLCHNDQAREFWRAVGFRDYAVSMELG